MVDNVFDLQFVLVVAMRVTQVTELLGQMETMRHILWRDEILSDLDAVLQISHLRAQI